MNYTKLLLTRLKGVDIIKVFSLNALSTFVRMLSGMISVKVVAIIIGPSGVALLGQLNNFSSILLGVSNGGINQGIIKYVSEYKNDDKIIKKYISNALKITLLCSALVGLILIIFCKHLSRIILLSDEYYYVYLVFGFTIILFTLNTLLISILNGYKQFERYVRISITGTLVGLCFSIFLVITWGLKGAMINAVTFQSVMFFVTLWMCRKMPWLKREYFVEKLDTQIVKKYFGFSLMTFTTIALLPVSQLLLRGYVISSLSASEAGIWEGMNRISNMYLSVVTSAFSIYYLPRLAELSKPWDLRNEIKQCYKVIVPTLLVIVFAIYLLRHFVLYILFTPEFYPMESLFSWQLMGDFFKICSWLLSFLMVAKAMTKMYIITEVCFSIVYIGLSFLFLQFNGIVGLTQGYMITYIIYFIAMILIFRNIILAKPTNEQ